MDSATNLLNGVADAAVLVLLGMFYVVVALLGFAGIIYSILWTIDEIEHRKPKR